MKLKAGCDRMTSVPKRLLLLAVAAASIAAAGCGGSSDGLTPAAEPATSPPLERRPAGRVLPIGNKPEGMVADPRTRLLAVGLTNPDVLLLYDMDSGETVRRIPLTESPRHLRLAEPGGPVLVPAERSDELVEVFLPGGRTRVTGVGDFPHDAASDGDGRIFVGDEFGDTMSVVEGGRRLDSLSAPVQPGGVVTSEDGELVAVVGVSERALELFDSETLRRMGKVDVGVGPTHVVARGRRFFVVDTRGNGLLEVLTEGDLRIHRRTALPGVPYGIAYDPRRKRFWVTLTETNEVLEVTDRRILRRYPAVRQPNTVAVDPVTGRVYVGSRKSGTLQIIDPRRDPGEEEPR
ncbi:lipoprotein [soil metagenome]